MTQRNPYNSNPFSSLTSLIFLVLFFLVLYFLAKSVFWILSMIAPVLIIATLIIDYKVLVGYGNWVIKLFKKNWVWGIGISLVTVVGFPVVAGFLFGKALLKRQVKKVQQQYKDPNSTSTNADTEYAEYEEVESTPKNAPKRDEPMETFDLEELERLEKRFKQQSKPKLNPKPAPKNDNDYEQLFD